MAERFFLGFERPALASAADFLSARYRQGTMLRMDRVTVVTPTGRAKRQLSALLSQTCQENDLRFLPPQFVTVSQVPELLYAQQLPFASIQTQQFAWTSALRELDAITRRRLLRANRESPNALTSDQAWSEKRWQDTGRIFWRLYRELAAAGLSFWDVAKAGKTLEDFPDLARWKAMGDLQQRYWELLRELNLWDKQSARLFAARKGECQLDADLVLVGATDINNALRMMLESERARDKVIALVHAPEQWKDRYDALGCIVPEAWQEAEVALRDDQWSVCDTPEDQAEAVAEKLGSVANACAVNQITIGCPDDRIVPYIQRQLHARQVASRSISGRLVSQTSPYLLLKVLGKWLASSHREDFAALARHPDLLDYLLRNKLAPSWVGELDQYHSRHLSATYDEWLGTPGRRERLTAAKSRVDKITEPLRKSDASIKRWANEIRTFMQHVFGDRRFNREVPQERDVLLACEAIAELLNEFDKVPDAIMGKMPAAEAIEVMLSSLAEQTIVPVVDPEAIEILGWLELPLDQSRVMIVAGIHDGTVPRSVSSDQFLPNRLREHLGVDDAKRRYARDACILATLLASREQVHLVMGRLTEDGDPLRPSRLVLATEGDELVRRWRRILNAQKSAGLSSNLDRPSEFGIPRPIACDPVTLMSVSQFKRYLSCPYRFYLQFVLKLRDTTDQDLELASAAYGDVVHDVLESFGNSGCKDSEDPAEIEDYLKSQLTLKSRKTFGDAPLPAVKIQLEQMRLLFASFAETQAARSREGWEIKFVEAAPPDGNVPFVVDGEPMAIRGRIDRIDQHRDTGAWEIIDYKSYAKSHDKTPRKTHQKDGRWIDLQLPLYRHLAASLGVTGEITLSYLLLPSSAETVLVRAGWTEEELELADEAAREVVRNVRNQVFWPPKEPASWAEPWDDICMIDVLESPVEPTVLVSEPDAPEPAPGFLF